MSLAALHLLPNEYAYAVATNVTPNLLLNLSTMAQMRLFATNAGLMG